MISLLNMIKLTWEEISQIQLASEERMISEEPWEQIQYNNYDPGYCYYIPTVNILFIIIVDLSV